MESFWLSNYIHSLIGTKGNRPVSESVYSFRVRAISDRDGLIGLGSRFRRVTSYLPAASKQRHLETRIFRI